MTVSDAEIAVVGAGLAGASAAHALTRRGAHVVLLEQFEPAGVWGASHGRARIFRMAYRDPLYVHLAQVALPLWRELEQETGVDVLTLTGAVDHGEPAALAGLVSFLRDADEPCETITAAAARQRWPGMTFDGDVLHHPHAGRLDAEAAVHAFLTAARACGAQVLTGTGVERVQVQAEDDVRLHCAGGDVVRVRQVVVAAGGWTAGLLAGVPGLDLPRLRVTQEQPALFAPLEAPWPSFIHHRAAITGEPHHGIAVYGLGGTEGVKVGFHGTGREVDPAHRRRDAADIDPAELDALTDYARRWLPGVDVARVRAQTCTYTSTVDDDFAIGRVGPVTVATGFSGHGFKFGPAIGHLVAGHVLGVPRTDGGTAVPSHVPAEVHAQAAARFSLTRIRPT
jgi:sarcosine oxidase